MRTNTALKMTTGLLAVLLALSCSRTPQMTLAGKILLSDNWHVQSSENISAVPGSVVSGNVIDITGWYPAKVPSTLMGVLTANGLYKDLFLGDSIKNIDQRQFEKSWWYRTEFTSPGANEDQRVMLNFDGISYYANVWLNSVLIASRDSIYGTFRRFEFDVTDLLKDSVNILAVEIFKQKPGDFGHGFVDWNPAPPDNSMGIWREVYLQITGDVAIRNTFISSDVNTVTLDEASLTITADVVNYSSSAVNGELTGKSEDFAFAVPVHLKAGEIKQVKLTPDDIKALRIRHPRLWWCNNLGEPNLYNLNIQYVTNSMVSDSRDIAFGIREIETYNNASGHRGFKLNGKEVLIKAGGWTDEIFFRDTDASNEIQVQYVKHMNLNTIRFENIWGKSQNIYDLCDQYGLLAMVGWSCQWEWENYLGKECDEFGGIKTEEDMDLMVESLEHQIRYLQNHPSVFVWLLGSDMLPRPALEKRYRELITTIDNRTYLAAASDRKSEISGPSGVKMRGPYNYVGPSYWYIDSVNGGAFGFNTETGPGPQIPVMETFVKMIPEKNRWPIDEIWNFHCNPSESFGTLDIFNNVLFQRYGKPSTLDNYMLKANVQGYEAMKGMFEAFRANRPNTTGIVQWMLNSAWPSFYWQLYDYYLLPTSAYYAARKANAPLQLVYNYGNNSIYTVNETLNPLNGAKARIRLLDIQGREILTEELAVTMEGNTSAAIYKLPPISGNIFLALSLLDGQNNVVTDNFYWLSGKPDVYDWEKTEWFYTPIKSSADFKPLNYLSAAEVGLTQKVLSKENEQVVEVTVTNKSKGIAFFINLTLKNSFNQTIFPVFWEDNYLSLQPGETRTIQCIVPGGPTLVNGCTLSLSGWNVKEQITNIAL
jgi:exo-1,4-beta-D-glucosaminidase